jgi:hypothetical protein
MRDKGVFGSPSRSVDRVVGIQEDEPSVVVERHSGAGGVEAVDRLALVGVVAEQVVVVAVHPVGVHGQDRERAAPVGHLGPQLPLRRKPGGVAEIGEGLGPLLDGPVGAVGRVARGDLVRQLGAGVRAAGIAERLQVGLAETHVSVLLPAARVVDLELNLGHRSAGRSRVDRPPDQDMVLLALGREQEQRLTASVRLEPQSVHVTPDQLRRTPLLRLDGGDRNERQHARTKKEPALPGRLRERRHTDRLPPLCRASRRSVSGRSSLTNGVRGPASSPETLPSSRRRYQRNHAGGHRWPPLVGSCRQAHVDVRVATG